MLSGSNILITGGNFFHQIQSDIHSREFDLLQQATSPKAFHDSGHDADPPRCLPNTREAIQDRIMEWTVADSQSGAGSFMMWLKGSAGVGKTAIARSIAEKCAGKGNLMASFFFSRFDPGGGGGGVYYTDVVAIYILSITKHSEHNTGGSRNNAGYLVSTLTYQMISKIPECSTDVAMVIKKDPLIFQRALDIQFRSLIVDPLQNLMKSGCNKYSGVSHVIVIDGLDECKDQNFQVKILEMFANLLPLCPLRIRLLVASRPERHLVAAFQATPVSNVATELDLNQQFSSYDVRTYFIAKFDEIKTTHQVKEHIPSDWPGQSDIYTLTRKASGQFIYASTVIKYVASISHHPVERLDNILRLRSTGNVAENPLAEVDALYLGILSNLRHPKGEVLKILTPVVFNNGLDESELEAFLGYRQGGIRLLLTDLASVVSSVEDRDGFKRISVFHASFEDFLRDSARSKDLCVSTPREHTSIVRRCFEILRARDQKLFRRALWLLTKHLPQAEINSEVKRDILSFPFPGFYFLLETASFLPSMYFSYLDYELKRLDPNLHHNRQKQFHEHVGAQLQDYYKHPGLTFLVVLVLHHRKLFSISRDHFNVAYEVAQLDKTAMALDRQSLMLCEFTSDPFVQPARKYFEVLQTCFQSESDYTLPGLTKQNYAVAALVSLKYAHSHDDHFRIDSLTPARQRIASSRNWGRELFDHALDVLAFVLPRSDYSTELVTLSRDVRLVELEGHSSWYLKKAKEAISDYLRQWDGQER